MHQTQLWSYQQYQYLNHFHFQHYDQIHTSSICLKLYSFLVSAFISIIRHKLFSNCKAFYELVYPFSIKKLKSCTQDYYYLKFIMIHETCILINSDNGNVHNI